MATIDLGGGLLLRPWLRGDEPSLAKHANNRNIWRNLIDGFPHPYTLADARDWVSRQQSEKTDHNFAITLEGEPIGGIGIGPRNDVRRLSAGIGYWLGEPFWGRGIATKAALATCDYAFSTFGVVRIDAEVFAWNPASMRVLEKAGFTREGVLRKAVFKDGQVIDAVQYALVR